MCGIVGMVVKSKTGFIKQQEDVFYQMLYADVVRGNDSTGVIGVEKDSTFHIAKEAISAEWFISQLDSHKISNDMWRDGKAYIGHNRKSTIGKTTDENAHPFVVNEEFAMVHNGTLFNHRMLANTTVDSEALAIHLHKAFENEDYLDDVNEALGKVSGAYAVAMYDQRNHAVRILRNKERPLCYVETSNAWYFASEGGMLYWILTRNGYGAKDIDIKVVPEHELITFDLVNNKLIQEQLTPKKHTTPLLVPTGGTKTKYTGDISKVLDEGLSKNAYKRFRKHLIGKKIEWWCEDFVEKNFPKTFEEGEVEASLMGVCDEFTVDHMIRADINIKELNLLGNELTDRLWTGMIRDMSYDPKTKRVAMEVLDAMPLPVSFRKTETKLEIIDAEYIRRKLDEQDQKTVSTYH
jgi:predicted glutamine amidotransferase